MSNQYLFKVNRKCFARLSSIFIVAFLILGMIAGFMQIQKCDATTPPTYVGPFHVSGNVILDAKNATIILKGIARMGPEYDTSFTSRETNPAYYAQDFAMMEGWGVNFIRQPFDLYAYNTSTTYRADLAVEVNAETSDDFFVLLDAHWFSTNTGQLPDGLWTNDAPITNSEYNITGQTAEQWSLAVLDPMMASVAQQYNSNPNVIGLEYNEFWPDSNRTQNWLSDQAIFQDMADYIHLTAQCPKYLIFWDMGFEDSQDFSGSQFKVGTSDSQEIVYALHYYIDPSFVPWADGYLGNSTYNSGWNWTAYYYEGDITDGDMLMTRYLNNYVLPIIQNDNVPCVADEVGCDDNCSAGLNNMLNYFDAQGWGYNYWAWYGTSTLGGQMCLLYGNWLSIRDNAYVLIQHLNYKQFFAWNNPSLNVAETYNWATGTVTDTISPVTPSYASTFVFADNFSTGTFSAWTGKADNAMLTTSPTYGFAYSAQRNQSSNNSPGFNVWKSLGSNYSTLYMGFDYYVNTLPPSGANNYIARMYDATGNNYLSIGLGNVTSEGGIGFGIFGANNGTVNINSYYTDNSFQADTWYSLVFGFNSTTVAFWIDGTEVFSSAATSPIPYSNIEIFSIGADPWTSKEYIDNVKVATSPINPDIISPMTLQLYALNITSNTQILLSNETILSNPLSYWNNESKLLAVTGLDPTITSIMVSNSPLSYTIVALSDTHSSISPSGPVQATYGSSQTFTYSADSGFTVTGVLVDGSTVQITGSYTFTNVTAPHTISISTILTATAKPTATPTPTPTPKLTPAPTPTTTPTSITSPTPSATNTKSSFALLLIIAIVVIMAGITLLAISIRKRNVDCGGKNHTN